MIRLHFVVDGKRDFGSIPRLVEGILDARISETVEPWARLHRLSTGRRGVKGFGRKLLWAIRQARDRGAAGLVAAVDRDKGDEQRLKQLRRARTFDRGHSLPLPTAIGQAAPHAEAWLLDDPAAVRQGLGIGGESEIPTVTKVDSPKNALDALIDASPRQNDPREDVLLDIAKQVDPKRCTHTKKTGYANFAKDFKAELGPLVPPSSDT